MLPNLCEWMQRDGTQVFRDLDEMLRAVENPERSWVLVGSMNALHCAHCVAAFRAGCNVFCEKPLCTSLDQAREMLQVQKDAGRHFATGFFLFFSFLFVLFLWGRLFLFPHAGFLQASC